MSGTRGVTDVPYEDALVASGILSDPFASGRLRFRERPLVLDRAAASELATVAERVAYLYDELVRVVAREPSLLDEFFGLTPCQKAMAEASLPLWHGIARADVFRTSRGLVITELNSDTPTGEPEAVVTGALALARHPGLVDPNDGLGDRFVGTVDALARGTLGADYVPTIGIVYPTDIPEDLSLVRLVESWFVPRGFRVVTGSPFNLRTCEGGGVSLFGERVSVVLRHYKTDWWGERIPVWKDEAPFPDPFPLVEPLETLLSAEALGKVAVVNPFGSVVTQNKRSMALFWERPSLFSAEANAIVRAHVPETLRLEATFVEQISAEREAWVLKSDYGCESDEVIRGRDVTPAVWDAALELALPGRWVVQRAFEAVPEAGGGVVNHGVYVMGGLAAGLYARVETMHDDPSDPTGATRHRTDDSVAVLLEP